MRTGYPVGNPAPVSRFEGGVGGSLGQQGCAPVQSITIPSLAVWASVPGVRKRTHCEQSPMKHRISLDMVEKD
jgi:hypothetical protein